MKSIYKKLSSLQNVLEKYYEIEKEIENIPIQQRERVSMLQRKKEEYIKDLERSENLKNKIINIENGYNSLCLKRSELEEKSPSITTQREFEMYQIELAKIKEKEHEAYNRREETKRKYLQISEKCKESAEELDAISAMVEGENSELNNRLEELKKNLASLIPQREKYSKDIDQNLLFKFERIVKSKNGGSVAVKGRVCQGCHMELPVQFVNTVRKAENIEFCPYCSRVLYYEKGDEDEIERLKQEQEELNIDEDNLLEDENFEDNDMDILSSDDEDDSLIASEDEFDI